MRCVITAVLTLFVVLIAAVPASAHRLDEYLQAMRVDVRPEGIVIELDLTPGANIAADVLAALDPDGDGTIDRSEADAYITTVLRSVDVAVDGEPLTVRLVNSKLPSVDDLRAGSGVIKLTATADAVHSRGRHRLRVANGYRNDVGVYLANALRPDPGPVTIASQSRDPRQQALTIDYFVGGPLLTRTSTAWTVFAVLLLGCCAYWRVQGLA
jgi:hypothetical protein